MNDVHNRIVVCCYRGRVGTDIYIYIINNNCNLNLIYRYSLTAKINSIYYSVTVTRCSSYSCFVLLKMGDSDARNMQSSCHIK